MKQSQLNDPTNNFFKLLMNSRRVQESPKFDFQSELFMVFKDQLNHSGNYFLLRIIEMFLTPFFDHIKL